VHNVLANDLRYVLGAYKILGLNKKLLISLYFYADGQSHPDGYQYDPVTTFSRIELDFKYAQIVVESPVFWVFDPFFGLEHCC